jgi:hypothetical protein
MRRLTRRMPQLPPLSPTAYWHWIGAAANDRHHETQAPQRRTDQHC